MGDLFFQSDLFVCCVSVQAGKRRKSQKMHNREEKNKRERARQREERRKKTMIFKAKKSFFLQSIFVAEIVSKRERTE